MPVYKKLFLSASLTFLTATSALSATDTMQSVRNVMSQIHGAEAMKQVSEWNEKTNTVLQSDPRYKTFYKDALEVGESPARLPMPEFLAGHIWNFWQDEQHPRGIWRETTQASYKKESPEWVTMLDIDKLAKDEKQNWVFKGAICLEPEERRCLISLSDGGEDAVTLREYDTKTGKIIPDGFTLSRSKQSVAWADENTFLVARDWDGTGRSLTTSGYPFVVRRVIRGQSPDQAIEIARGEKTDVSVSGLSLTDGDGNHLFLINRSPTFFTTKLAVIQNMDMAGSGQNPGTLLWLNLPERITLEGMIHGRLVLSLNEDWTTADGKKIASGSLISVDPTKPDTNVGILWAPDKSQALDEIAITKNNVIVSYFENVRGRASVIHIPESGTGQLTRSTLTLPDMSTIHIAAANQHTDEAFLTSEGYITPPQLWETEGQSSKTEQIKQMPALFDASDLTVDQLWTTSTDGTKIPYFLVHKSQTTDTRPSPTLLTAYGGFQASYTPTYAPEIGRLWLTRGGNYAVANIRGGGEFGPAWHEAGRKTQRQRIYNDFAAVGQDLVSRGITSVKKLGIRGRSNGGLLMGVEFTQHPELWNAVIIGVPLLDMMNYETMAAGASWEDEYGTVSKPKERAFLKSISPLQNLRAGIHYPEPFIFTSTTDDRVGPVHARLFAMRLKQLGVPFFYYEDTEGGHAGTVNAKEVAHERALEAVYLSQRLMDPN
ncbi:MAG: prolyl oligopeptidase family serine peptidase [Acetobacter sp.]|jgi:prolyl oligopeptidase